MKIRPAVEADIDDIEKILNLPELAMPNGGCFSAEMLRDRLDERYFLVAEENDGIIGAIFGEPLKSNGMLIWEFAVKENSRGKGVGSELLAALEKNMGSGGITWAVLYAPKKSLKVMDFYDKRGYKKGNTYVEFLKFLDIAGDVKQNKV